MDLSEKYIKMCTAATHLKSLHPELIEGDFYVYHMRPTSPHVKIFHEGGTYQNDMWLPRLDQLLEIAGGRSSKIHILSCFCKWVESQELQDATWGMKFQTYEQMALLFVMHELYSMTWNGERWEKVE